MYALALALLLAGCAGSDDAPKTVDTPSDPSDTDTPTSTDTVTTPPPEPTVPACGYGLTECGEDCVDTETDDQHCGGCDTVCEGAQHCGGGACVSSAIQHVVIVVQENHTFDSYFADWCQAPAYSEPTCTTGPACCEAGPDTDPGTGALPIKLDDQANIGSGPLGEDPNHNRECELAEIDGGLMDRFVAGADVPYDPICGNECSRPENFAYSNEATVGPYWDLAEANAVADRYFQPTPGATTANTLYLLTAHWLFDDADYRPDSIGSANPNGTDAECVDPTGVCLDGSIRSWPGGDTIADRLAGAGIQMTGFIEGYQAAVDATRDVFDGGTLTGCAHASDDCPYFGVGLYACVYEPADVPFQFFDTLRDDPTTEPGTTTSFTTDYADFAKVVANGALPPVAYVHGYTFRNEHPKFSTITDGIAFTQQTIDAIEASDLYRDDTLVLVVWDEGGGFFDHVDPVAAWPVAPDADDLGNPVPHGTRVPLIAIGPMVRHGEISHVVLDHSSIVAFLEYNFLAPDQWVGEADLAVHNLGSLLDPAKTGFAFPE